MAPFQQFPALPLHPPPCLMRFCVSLRYLPGRFAFEVTNFDTPSFWWEASSLFLPEAPELRQLSVAVTDADGDGKFDIVRFSSLK
jgi:hypothetical protein